MQDRPIPGKVYALTGAPKEKAISNGNTWAESEVHDCSNRYDIWGCEQAARPCAHAQCHNMACDDCGQTFD
jgi:hypothetical protein